MGILKKNKVKQDSCQKVELKKNINIVQGISIIVGVIIGSGIFVSPVGVIAYTKSVGSSFVMWAVTGLFSALGAIVYAELGVTIPRSGGEYIYILECFGPLPAFLCLWITFTVIGAASCAANSLIFAEYVIKPFFFTCSSPTISIRIIAILGLMTLCIINCLSVKLSMKLAVVFTACKVFALLLIIGFGAASLVKGNVSSFKDSFEGSATSPGDYALAFYQGFWAFAGWNYLNFLTGEVKNPSKNMPIMIILSLSLVTTIYILANVAYLAVLSPVEMLSSGDGSSAVALAFAERSMGMMYWVMPIFVGASVFGSINSEVLSLSRLTFTAAEEGHMPAILSMVNVTRLTPIPSVLLVVILGLCFQLYPDIFYLIELTGMAFTVISSMAICSLLKIRKTDPGRNKSGFKLPIIFPITFLVVNIAIGCLAVYGSPKESLLSLGLMAMGIPVYLIGVAWKKKPLTVVHGMYKLTVGMQKLFFVIPTERVDEQMVQPEDEMKMDYLQQSWSTPPTP